MSSEQKDILGIISKRQLAYILGGVLILYKYIPFLFKLFSGLGWSVATILCLFMALPIVIPIVLLGFTKVEKHNMFRDQYYWIKIRRKSQYGSWRKAA